MKNKTLIRPHHLVCINFFRGKGYSEEFVNNFQTQKDYLETNNPIISLESSFDIFCNKCPHKHNKCDFSFKVEKYDKTVLDNIKLDNNEMHYLDFNNKIKELLSNVDIKNICGDCEYNSFCSKLQKEIYKN